MFSENRLITIEGKLNRMARQVAKVMEFITDAEREKIIDWLSTINFFPQHADIFRRCQRGTGEWILADEKFKRWESGSGGILWGRGIPGAGKTVLASVVVDHLTKNGKNNNIGVACIYLNHKETTAQTPSNLLAAVWRQLVLNNPIAEVLKLFRMHSKKRTRPELAEIHDVLRSVVAQWAKVYIVVDALDETSEDTRKTLLDYLTKLGPTVCLMLTSRPNISLPKINPDILEIHVPEDDIQTYVKEQINNSGDLALVVESSDFRDIIIAKIVDNVDGMFLLAKLHVDSVKECPTVDGIRDVLGNLSRHLNKAYDTAMERIENRPEQLKKLANSALAWVANAEKPLSVEELQEALSVKQGAKGRDLDRRPKIELVLSVCCGLIIIDQESTTVRLVHFTTQDYLNGRFPGAHMEIARTLFTYMMFDEIQTLLGDSKNFKVENVKTQYALLPYCYSCYVHAAGQPEEDLRDMIVDSLKQAVRWNRVFRYAHYGWMRPWNYMNWPESPSPLWVASCANLYKTVQHLLDNGIPSIDNDFPLVVASKHGHTDVVRLLLEHGAAVHAEGDGALRRASEYGHLDVVQLLIEHGAAVHAEDNEALWKASGNGRFDVVQLLLEHGAAVHAKDNKALRKASWNGRLDVVQLLIEHGADVHAEDNEALRGASENGHVDVVQLLIEHGAAVHAEDNEALWKASGNGCFDVVQLLLEHGAAVHAKDNKALRKASWNGRLDVVQLLLGHGAAVHAENDGALRAASRYGHIEIVRLLLEYGAAVHAGGDQALREASRYGHLDVVQLLLEHGATVHTEKDGALRAAFEKGHLEVVRLLLEHNADVQAHKNGALRAASKAGYKEVVQLLLDHGVNVNAADEDDVSALEAAACWDGYCGLWDSPTSHERAARRLELVRLLLEHNADVHAHNNGALRAGSRRGHQELIQLLLEHGANVNAADENDVSALEAAASWNGGYDMVDSSSSHEKAAHRLELVRLLLEHDADVHAYNNGALRAASREGHREVVELLLEHGANVNAADGSGVSALEDAAGWDGSSPDEWDTSPDEMAARRLELVGLLLKHGADVHAHNNGALRAASRKGSKEVVQLLLEHGTNVNASDENDVSALEAAACWDGSYGSEWPSPDDRATRRLELVGLLLEHIAGVHVHNNDALRAASKRGHKEVVQLLLENGAEVNAADEKDVSALEAAAGWDGMHSWEKSLPDWVEHPTPSVDAKAAHRLDLVRLLLEHNADVHAHNNGALRAASEKGHKEVVQILLENGTDASALEIEPELQDAETESQNAAAELVSS
ncbi:ankyrin repeat-containing domain protein [Mycena crocata]|nr:ankyrin repeat-containing domain protein [Mycena crocata]